MRSAWVRAPFEVELRTTAQRAPGPGEVLVRVDACGICGTDLHFARTVAESWMPLGHEAVGVVEAAGSPADAHLLGRAVAALNYTACNRCDPCKNGDWAHCTAMPSYMEPAPAWQAGVGEYLVLRADMVQPYSDIDPILATLVEPASVALDLVETVGIPWGSEVAVFGPGPIGLLAIRFAKQRGARRVLATIGDPGSPRGRRRAEAARAMGADEIIEASRGDLPEQVKALCPEGLDRVLVTAPPRTLPDAIRVARFGGVIGLIGIEFGAGAKVELDINEFHFKKLQLRASHAIPDVRFPAILSALRDRSLDVSLLVTHVFELEESARALQVAAARDEPVIKVVVDCRAGRSRGSAAA